MRRSICTTVSVLGLAALLFPASGLAQQKYSYSHSTAPQSSRYVQQRVIDVDDMPGHQLRILEVQRKYTRNHPVISGVKVVEVTVRGFSDYTNGVGPAQGYSTWILEDGNKVYAQWSGTSYTTTTSTGSQQGTYNGMTYFIGGTGEFATLRGVLTEKSEFNTDPESGYNKSSSIGEYWFAE
jgi:hypothetical protein